MAAHEHDEEHQMNRVVVTGRGVVSPVGSTVPTFLGAFRDGAIGIRPAPWVEDDVFAWWAVVTDFVPSDWMDAKIEEGTDLFAQYAIAASEQAVQDAGLSEMDPMRTAIVHGTSMGGLRSLMRAQHDLDRAGPDAIDRKTMIQILPNMAASQLAMRWDLHGPLLTITTACASSIDAIGHAARMIRSGEVDVALAGATEGGTTRSDGGRDGDFAPAWFHAQARYGMSTDNRDERRAIIPFDRDRAGIVAGEGCAMVVLESEEHARRRGAPVIAEVKGYASLADGHHPSSPEPTGRWEAEVMRKAILDARLQPTDIDALFAHGTGTPKGDAAEILAINAVHGGRDLPVTSLKGHTGHTGASSGAMSLIMAGETLATGFFPNVAGTKVVEDEADFRVVIGEPQAIEADDIQINSFGFGGQNASLVVGRHVR
jgi:3-oxoacyl-[acyl-carrier-protein] synthase II